jgi:hypothetical protein
LGDSDQAGGRDTKQRFYYDLIMGSKERAELRPGQFLVNLEPETVLSFRFNDEHRKDLAQLKQGQQVTVEGLCDRNAAPGEGGQPPDVVNFDDCKIIKTGE